MGEFFRLNAKDMFNATLISVTVVRVSPDLSIARVYLSIMGNKPAKEIIEKIREASFAIKKKISAPLGKQLRVIPEFQYFVDDSYDYASHIDDLLKR